ncbi:tail assembly chaperone [Haloarcula tailed virus 2]|uniref:Tail assembly chaperone n=1 Tax=Haloarcula tailed virus 2 TaxID=2877989 RepID=A0AAE8Y1L3_9CAUD|nr:tail assembly chaperone [Haloarcula tailed virus 2]UBF23173.1 tail assembly chaperone [Haloarcula tailed virus 2]
MSDLFRATKKVKEGKLWRGSVHTVIDGEELEFTVRQLVDPELQEVLSKIDMDELEELKGDLPEELTEEYRELSEKEDELTDEESERLVELEDELSNVEGNLFDVLSNDTMDAFRMCAMYGVVPDDEDIATYFQNMDYVSMVEEEYGIEVKTPKDLYDAELDGRPNKSAGPLKDTVQNMVLDMQKFASFSLGMKVFKETMGNRKN